MRPRVGHCADLHSQRAGAKSARSRLLVLVLVLLLLVLVLLLLLLVRVLVLVLGCSWITSASSPS